MRIAVILFSLAACAAAFAGEPAAPEAIAPAPPEVKVPPPLPPPPAERPLPASADDLAAGLTDPDAKFAERCSTRLVEMGDAAAGALEKAVKSGADPAAAAAVPVLAAVLEKDSKRLAVACAAALSLSREAASSAALRQLAAIREPSTASALIDFLRLLHQGPGDVALRARLKPACVSALESATGKRFVRLECGECSADIGVKIGAPCPECGARLTREAPDVDKWLAWWKEEQARKEEATAPVVKGQ
jgi:hypothetical protein